MAGIAACRNDTGHYFAHKWLAWHGYAYRSAPGLRDFNLVQGGVNLRNLSADMFAYVAGIVGCIGLTTTKQQATILGFAEIAYNEARVIDRLSAGDDWTVIAQRCCCANERPDRHDVGGTCRFQIAAMSIDRDEGVLR